MATAFVCFALLYEIERLIQYFFLMSVYMSSNHEDQMPKFSLRFVYHSGSYLTNYQPLSFTQFAVP